VPEAVSHHAHTVQVVHAAVAGRLRLRSDAIRYAPHVASAVEAGLSRERGIRSASANPLTGNILVLHTGLSSADVVALVEQCVREAESADTTRPPSRVAVGWQVLTRSRVVNARRTSGSERNRSLPDEAMGADVPAWHCLTPDDALATLHSSSIGLTGHEAGDRLGRHGPNRLQAAGRRSLAGVVGRQLTSVPVMLLAGSAVLSIATGGVGDAVVILVVVVANAAIGAYTEHHAEATVTALTRFELAPALAQRDGRACRVEVPSLVPGDVIALGRGDVVPADARLLDVDDLTVDESALTGESVAVTKVVAPLAETYVPLADRRNMVYRGSTVTGGSGLAAIVATGSRTEVGRVQSLVVEAGQPDTPLQRQLGRLGHELMVVTSVVAGGLVAIGLLRGYRLTEILRTAISLAVAAVPEGLPTVATTTLAAGVRRLRTRGLLVRRLDAIETLGAIQVIGLDKTGTITTNRMAVEAIRTSDGRFVRRPEGMVIPKDGSGEGNVVSRLASIIRVGVLCSDAGARLEGGDWTVVGTPTEAAIVRLAIDAGYDPAEIRTAYPLVGKQGRAERRMYMATLHESPHGRLLAIKGRPDQVLTRCSAIEAGGSRREMRLEDRMAVESENERMAGAGLRVLGFAVAEGDTVTLESDAMTWVGLVGIADPPRPGIRALIEGFYRAGVKPVMITGDQSSTATSIAREIGLGAGRELVVLDSAALAGIPEDLLAALVTRVDVFSRVSPEHKLNVIRALQRAGVVVAMTGDGINDGPALRAADVGIALGRGGTDVARETADIVLLDDEVDSLLAAVAEGRTIGDDLRKAVHFVVATNLSEVLVTTSAVALGLPVPLNATQLLWINLLTDVFPELALAAEPPAGDVLRRPPRASDARLVERSEYSRIGGDAGVMTLAALVSYGLGMRRSGAAGASTMAFVTLTAAQLLHGIGARSEEGSLLVSRRLPPNRYMSAAVGGGIAFQLAAGALSPIRRLTGAARVPLADAAAAWGLAGLSFLVTEVLKYLRHHAPPGDRT
jgi:Ca2+-transporting ATPase